MTITNEQIKNDLQTIKESILKTVPATAIYLFGSHAYGEPNNDSDLDIYVVVPTKDMCNRDTQADIIMDFHKKGSMPIDLIFGDEVSFNNRVRFPTLERQVSRNGVKIHG